MSKHVIITESQLQNVNSRLLAEETTLGRGRFTIYSRGSHFLIADHVAHKDYYFYKSEGKWQNNSVPDFTSLSFEDMKRVFGEYAEPMVKAAQAITGQNNQAATQRLSPEAERQLGDIAMYIKRGNRVQMTDEQANLLIQRKLVTPEQLEKYRAVSQPKPQTQPQTQSPSNASFDKWKGLISQIKNGNRVNIGEREADWLLRSGTVTPQELAYSQGWRPGRGESMSDYMPNTYGGGYNNRRY